MDEDYLDSLLGQATDDSKMNNDFDSSVAADSGVDLDLDDLGDISLEEMDDFDELDMGDLELDDIDFDDVDVTSFDVEKVKTESPNSEEEDYSLDNLINDDAPEENLQEADPEEEAILESVSDGNDVFSEADNDLFEDLGIGNAKKSEETETAPEIHEEKEVVDTAPNFEEMFNNAEVADDDVMQSLFGGNDSSNLDRIDSEAALDELLSPGSANRSEGNSDSLNMGDMNVDEMNIDDLFSALGIDGDGSGGGDDYTKSEAELDDLFNTASMETDASELADIEDISDKAEAKPAAKKKKEKKKKVKKNKKAASENEAQQADEAVSDEEPKAEKTKKTFSEILFGEPDEDDLEEEKRLLAKKEQKKVAKEEKAVKKEEKKAEKEATLTLKKENAKKTKLDKAEKKKAKEQALAEEEAEENKNQKPVSNPVVVIVFLIFAAIGGLSYFGSQYFNYSEVIRKATDYFERHRFRLAYDEVSGVDVKKKDELLRDRIYTVMYVERLYESYENNMKLDRPDKALDALLRGIEKYDEHYEEAIELEIKDDIDISRAKIIDALALTYGLTEADAYKILELDGNDYLNALAECCKVIDTGEKDDNNN